MQTARKRLLSMLLSLCMTLTLAPSTAWASKLDGTTPDNATNTIQVNDASEPISEPLVQAETVTSGTCGETVTWTLDNTGTLAISGTGEMTNYTDSNTPWYTQRDTIQTVRINDGVTSIGAYAFYQCYDLTSITISNSIKAIEDRAFSGCDSLADVYYGGTEEQWKAITIGNSNEPLLKATIHYNGYVNLSADYPVIFEPNGGTMDEDQKIQTAIVGQTYGELPTPVRDGYLFDGWFTDSAGGEQITSDIIAEPMEELILYAHWTQVIGGIYVITFDPNDGILDISSTTKTVIQGQTYGELPEPVRDGYLFSGWFTEITGGEQVTSETIFGLTADQILYAHWTQVPAQKKAWEYFKFSNSSSNFFNDGDTRDHNAGSYFNHFDQVLDRFYPGEFLGYKKAMLAYSLKEKQSKPWGGSCYGFAVIEGMVNNSLFPAVAIDGKAGNLPSVDLPCKNIDVRNLLNYYWMSAAIPALRSQVYQISTSDGQQALLDMAGEVITGTPYMFSYFFDKNGSVVGHSIILESGQVLSDGSYKLVGQDNRFHGYTICEQENGSFLDTGKPITVAVLIPEDGSKCTVSLTPTYAKRDGKVYWYSGVDEQAYSFEPTKQFDKFASIEPTGYANQSASIQAYSAADSTDSTSSIIYYAPNPDNTNASFVLKGQDDNRLIDGSDFQNIQGDGLKNHWYTAQSTIESSGREINGITVLETKNAPASLMAELTPTASEQTQYTITEFSGGTISYVGADSFASVNTKQAESIKLDRVNNTVTLEGNSGEFSISVANSDAIIATVTGHSNDLITVTPTDTGITLDAPAGIYEIVFADANQESENSEVTKVIRISDEEDNINIDRNPQTSSEQPVVVDTYKEQYDVQIIWTNEQKYTLLLTAKEGVSISDSDTFTAWQAEYNQDDKLLKIQELESEKQASGFLFAGEISTANTTTGSYCSLFVLDRNSIPVIQKYNLRLN